jgi:uncharacterized membrane protein
VNAFPPGALALIIFAAFLHVVPHVAIKGARDRTAFVFWMLLVNAVVYAPLLLLTGALTPMAWLLIITSGIAEVVYLLAISRAYATGDLSVAYPLARGTAPIFLLLLAVGFLHERVTTGGVAGLLLIAAGIYLLNVTRLAEWTTPLRSLRLPASRWAVFAGLCTAAYTSIDKVGVTLVHPLAYLEWVMIIALLAYLPLMTRGGWVAAREELRSAPIGVILAGVTMPLAYALVLWAMHLGARASYTGAVREVSVVVAAAVGILVFGERASIARLLGTITVLAGIIAIVWRG